MSEQTITVESSTTTPVIEIDRGPLVTWTPEQRAEFRRTGDMPEPPKKEESAPSDTGKDQPSETEPEGKAESAGESEPPQKPQEHGKKNNAETRKAQLSAEIQSLLKERDRLRADVSTAKTQPAESSPAKVEQPQPQQLTRPKPTLEDKKQDGTAKYADYNDFVEDLADWKTEQRLAEEQRKYAAEQQQRAFQAKVAEAKSRYENFDEVAEPFLKSFLDDQQVPLGLKQVFADSEIWGDLAFTIGRNAKESADFLEMARTKPTKAVRYIALTESLIHEELAAKSKPAEPKPPAKTQTSAPKPPAEVGGRAAAPPDALDSAVQAGDFRAAKAEMTRRALAKLKA